jgi:hypothetical protein
MVSSIVKTAELAEIVTANDLTVDQIDLRWGYIESSLITITLSIPCLRDLAMSTGNNYLSRDVSHSYELRISYWFRKDNHYHQRYEHPFDKHEVRVLQLWQ